jgi:dihydrofolate reductase
MTSRKRRIIYYVAASADGFIARPDGAVDWLDRPHTAGDYGMGAFYRSVDTVLLGRKTWEVGVLLGETHFKGKKNYVFSRTRRRFVPQVELVKEPVKKFARRLRAEKGKDIWLVGGGSLFASFLDAGEVDAVVVHVIPTLIGAGIPLVAPARRNVSLRLVSSRKFSDGVVRLEYAVPGRQKNIPS